MPSTDAHRALRSEQCARNAAAEEGRHLVEKRLSARAAHQHGDARARAELPRAKCTGIEQLASHLMATRRERDGKHEHGVRARHLEVDRSAGPVRGFLQPQSGFLASRESGGPDGGVRHQPQPDVGRCPVDELHGSAWQARLARGVGGEAGEHAAGAGVSGVGLGDHGVAGRDGRDEIATGDRVEREGEIVGAEDDHAASQRAVLRPDVRRRVDRGAAPRTIARGRGRLAHLAYGPRQFDLAQARARGQPRFARGHIHQRVPRLLDLRGVALEKAGDVLRRDGAEFRRRFSRRANSPLDFESRGDRVRLGRLGLRGGIDRSEGARGVIGLAPFAIDEDRFQRHARSLRARRCARSCAARRATRHRRGFRA